MFRVYVDSNGRKYGTADSADGKRQPKSFADQELVNPSRRLQAVLTTSAVARSDAEIADAFLVFDSLSDEEKQVAYNLVDGIVPVVEIPQQELKV